MAAPRLRGVGVGRLRMGQSWWRLLPLSEGATSIDVTIRGGSLQLIAALRSLPRSLMLSSCVPLCHCDPVPVCLTACVWLQGQPFEPMGGPQAARPHATRHFMLMNAHYI